MQSEAKISLLFAACPEKALSLVDGETLPNDNIYTLSKTVLVRDYPWTEIRAGNIKQVKKTWNCFFIFFISILNTFIMVCSIYFLRIILSAQVSLDNFVLLGFFGVLAYLLSSYVSDKVFNYGLFGLIYSRITALKS